MIPPYLTISIIRYGSRVKWSNPGRGVAPSSTPWCSSYWKGNLRVTLDYVCQLLLYLYQKKIFSRVEKYTSSTYTWHCWSKDKIINILLWIPTYGHTRFGWSARTNMQQLCAETGRSLENLPGVIDNRDRWREKVKEVWAISTTWWWWVHFSVHHTTNNKVAS